MASLGFKDPFTFVSTPTGGDVFLSFHNGDTLLNFTGHLYSALDRHGLKTFLEDPELRNTGVISNVSLQAIEKSKTYVVVFSKNYASSRRCLDELIEICKSNQTTQRKVIFVFYNIDPLVVKPQIKRAFKKLETGFDMDRLAEWVSTLQSHEGKLLECYEVGKDRSEYDIINQVVHKVLFEIKVMTLHVATYPVGLESRVEDIRALLSSCDTEGVFKIGIFGMGGVGKTTLAKAVYNQIYHQFEGSCFLADVREASETEKGIVSLQQQLIDDVLQCKNITIDNVDQGIELIRARVGSSKVLIVIDDLDDPNPLEFLEGPFAEGSIIILTTRNEDLLDSIDVDARYSVNELNDVESRQLFSQHAFGEDKISEAFTELSEEILAYAGGLPLALEFFGSNLFQQSEDAWRWFIKETRVSTGYVEKKLLISFDSLGLIDPMLQDIFLDIACLFIGWKREEVVKIMETYYIFVNSNIDILKRRCLLTINSKDELGMHDLLRDMGRKIAHNNSPDEPGKRSRLWLSKDICNVLKKHTGTEVIEGIIPQSLDYQDALEDVSFTTEAFKRMGKLRFLYFKNVTLTGSFEQKFEDLRWLCWEYCPLKCLPTEFYPQKLVTLLLPHSKMRTMWELNMVPKVLAKLKTLNMSYSLDLTMTPDFKKLPCLESLNFDSCKSLEEVHVSIGKLDRLVILNLCSCVNLKSLPDTTCNLRALESLTINGCSGLEKLPTELGNIKSLKDLNAEGLSIMRLPDSIGRLKELGNLHLSNNENLTTLPDTIGNLRSLENLSLENCRRLSAIVELPPNLKQIRANGCTSMKRLPNLSNLKQLEVLDLADCSGLTEIHGLNELTSLRALSLAGCNSSLLACTYTKHFFQIYSGFGHQVNIYTQLAEFPDWISHSSNSGSTLSLDLQPNESHNFLGMVFCLKVCGDNELFDIKYSVKTTTSDLIWSDDRLYTPYYHESWMVIVPRSFFSAGDGDDRIELTANAEIHGFHLLYKQSFND